MLKDNFAKMTKTWTEKMKRDRQARYKMLWDKIAKLREGEESLVFNQSVANIME